MKVYKSKKFYSLLFTGIAITMLVLVILPTPVEAAGLLNSAFQGGPGESGQNGSGRSETGGSLTPLTESEKDDLRKAIFEEYKAYNLYKSVMEQLGSIVPFEKISQSELQHISALTRQAEKFGVEVPANPGLTNAPDFVDLKTACQAGVAAETEDAALYDLLKASTKNTNLLRVYNNLQKASLQNHLVEFQTCN